MKRRIGLAVAVGVGFLWGLELGGMALRSSGERIASWSRLNTGGNGALRMRPERW